MTFKLPYSMLLVGIVMLLFGYHFGALELKIIGGLYLGYGTIIHLRNVRLVRNHYEKQRHIL